MHFIPSTTLDSTFILTPETYLVINVTDDAEKTEAWT